MHLAGRTESLCLHERAPVDAGQGIVVQLLALRAQAAFGGAVLFAAVESDHLADQQLFLCAFFVQILRGLRHRVRSS